MKKDGAAAWVAAGVGILRKEGHVRLTVDRLCAAMKKTKGSFYHHFADIHAFEDAVLARWKAEHTQGPIDAADAHTSVRDRRRALYGAVASLDLRVELAIRAWAVADARARQAQVDVDRARVLYLSSLWGKGKRASTAAQLEYAAFLGLLGQYGEEFRKHTPLLSVLLRVLEDAP